MTATLAEEEEKAKHLLKLKAKHESTIGMGNQIINPKDLQMF